MSKCFECEKYGSYYCDNYRIYILCYDCWDIDRRKSEFAQSLTKLIRQQKETETIQGRIEEKKKEQEALKNKIEGKLGNLAFFLEDLLEKQENFDFVVFPDVRRTSRSFLQAEKMLQDSKDRLIARLSPEEVEEFCQVQTEISKLELEVVQLEREKEEFVEQIGTMIDLVKELEWEREDLAKEVDIWKKDYANQKEKLTQKQTYIEELEVERATNYENFMDEYGKTMEDFYKRQGINTGDYKEHLQDYIFSKQLREENKQLKEQVKQMEKQLEAKVEIPPK